MRIIDIDVIRIQLLGCGIRLRFMRGNYNPKTGDGSINKYSIDKIWSKYSNPYFNFTINYNYDFTFYLMLNRS